MHRALRTVRGDQKQLRHGFDVPVRILWPCMAEIGAELAHLTIWVEPVAIPCHDRANSEGVSKIVDARSTSSPAEALRVAQTDRLRDDGEVVSSVAFAHPTPEPVDRARGDRHEACATVLAALHRDD